MDPSLDDFITYDNQFVLKHNSIFDGEFSISSPFSENSDATGVFPPFLPKTIQNLLDPEAEPQNRDSIFSSLVQKPTQSQNSNEGSQNEVDLTASNESLDYVPEEECQGKKQRKTKLNPESKRINKREKAKERKKAKKTSTEVLLQKADPKHIPEEMSNPNLDDETRKKMVQMIRNRISAQNSRDRKKFYIQQLEEMRDLLTEENTILTNDKKTLGDKLKNLEADHKALIQELSNLKKSLPPLCSSCGFTMDYSRNQDTTEDNSSRERSGDSSPFIERGQGHLGRGFFGFSMAFTALLCLIFVLSTDSSGGKLQKGTYLAIPRSLMDEFQPGTCKESEQEQTAVMMTDEGSQTVDIPFEEIQTKYAEIKSNEDHILNRIKPLMDQFEKLHENFYQKYESNKLIVDISKTKISDIKLVDDSTLKAKNISRNFLEKKSTIATPNKTMNKTSTLFCPSGFEFFKANATAGQKPELNAIPSSNQAHDDANIGPRTLDLEKAEYIQLLLPKQSIGRLGVTENSSEINNLPNFYEAEEQNSIIEVWCKVFAVRDYAASL